jgi:hypothetical protein
MKKNYRPTLTHQGLFLLVALLGSLSTLFAQSNIPTIYWQTVLDKTNTPDYVRGEIFNLELARLPDGGSAVVGNPILFTSDSSKPFVTKLDPTGKIVWTKDLTNFFTPSAVQAQPNGDIVVAGNFASTSFAPNSFGFVRFNSDGFMNHYSALDLPDYLTKPRNLGDMVPAPDGGFLLVGYEYPSTTPGQRLDMVLARVDHNLNLKWYKNIGGSGATFLFKAVRATEGGGYLIHAQTSATTITGNPDTSNGLSYDFKIDEAGNIVWQKVGKQNGVFRAIAPRKDGYFAIGDYGGRYRTIVKLDNQLNQIQDNALPNPDHYNEQFSISIATTPDGGCIAVDKFLDSSPNGPHSDYRITKFSPNLEIEWQEQGGGPGNDDARRVIVNPDGTYLIAGTTASPSLFGGVDDEGKMSAWVRRQAVTVNALQLRAPTYNCATGAITFNTVGGDGTTITFDAPGITRTSLTSNTGTVEAELRADPKPILLQAIQSGVTVSLTFDLKAFCNGGGPAPGGGFSLTQPTYNCATGAITFNTVGGDGTTITFDAPGITRTSLTSNTGTVEAELRGDPKPIPLQATQSGVTVSFTFDLKAFCNGGGPAPGGGFSLTQPTYNCATGAITFNTTGGDGTTITFDAPGITRASLTSNTGTVEAELRGDPKPIPLQATQSGKTTSYLFDLPNYCGAPNRNARLGEDNPNQKLVVKILENPVHQQLRVQLIGASQDPIQLRITDLQGHLLQNRNITPDQRKDEQVFRVDQFPVGLFLLQATAGQQGQVIKFLKQ